MLLLHLLLLFLGFPVSPAPVWASPAGPRPPGVGDPAVDFALPDRSGRMVSTRDVRGQKGLYLVFWQADALRVDPARLLPFAALSPHADAWGIATIVVVLGQRDGALADWLAANAPDLTVVWDPPTGTVGGRPVTDLEVKYGVTSSPFRVAVDRDGIVRATGLGFTLRPTLSAHALFLLLPDLEAIADPAKRAQHPSPWTGVPVFPAPGEALPPFALPDLSGRLISTETLRGESALVIVFWFAGCPFSDRLLYELDALYAHYRDRRVEFIAVNIDPPGEEGKARAQAWLRASGLGLPVVRDETGDVADRFGVVGVPSLLVADRTGVVRHVLTKWFDTDGEWQALVQALEGVAAGSRDPPAGRRPKPALLELRGHRLPFLVRYDALVTEPVARRLADEAAAWLPDLYPWFGITDAALGEFEVSLAIVSSQTPTPCGCNMCGCTVYRPGGPGEAGTLSAYAFYSGIPESTQYAVKHELTHVLLRARVGETPRWFSEGVAEAFSRTAFGPIRDVYMKYLYSDFWPSAAEVDRWLAQPSMPGELGWGYTVSHVALVYLIETYGRQGFRQLMDAMAAGPGPAEAIEHVFGLSEAAFWGGVKAFVVRGRLRFDDLQGFRTTAEPWGTYALSLRGPGPWSGYSPPIPTHPPNTYALSMRVVGRGQATLAPAPGHPGFGVLQKMVATPEIGWTFAIPKEEASWAYVIEAVPEKGWRFSHWDGDLPDRERTSQETTVYIDANRWAAAVFVENPLPDADDGARTDSGKKALLVVLPGVLAGVSAAGWWLRRRARCQ